MPVPATETIAVVAFDGISPFHLSVTCMVFGEDRTESGEQSGAAVGAGRSTEGHDDPAGVAPQQRDDGLADSLAGGFQRGKFPAGQSVQAAGVGDLDDGGGAVERGDGGALVAGGPGDGDADAAEPGLDGGLDAAVSAVGERQSGELDPPFGEPIAQVLDHLGGGEAALEFVRCEEDLHDLFSSSSAVTARV